VEINMTTFNQNIINTFCFLNKILHSLRRLYSAKQKLNQMKWLLIADLIYLTSFSPFWLLYNCLQLQEE